MKKQKLTKEQRKDLVWKEYEKVKELAWKKYLKVLDLAGKKYLKECRKINAEPDEMIIEHNGRKYKLIEEGEK